MSPGTRTWKEIKEARVSAKPEAQSPTEHRCVRNHPREALQHVVEAKAHLGWAVDLLDAEEEDRTQTAHKTPEEPPTPTQELLERRVQELEAKLVDAAHKLNDQRIELSRVTDEEVERAAKAMKESSIMDDAAEKLQDAERRVQELEEALTEAIDEFEYASQYKGAYLAEKHGDAAIIERLWAVYRAGHPEAQYPAPSKKRGSDESR
jgi:hypothetical protein